MTAPTLSFQVQGQASVSADQLNTFVQWANTVADLRAFSGGVNGQMVILNGQNAIADLGGGPFYWNAASTAADNGTTIIAPAGTATGRWLRLGYFIQSHP